MKKKSQPKAKLLETVTSGKSRRLSDNAYWLKDIPAFHVDLLDELDRTKDPKLLLQVLDVPKAVLPHFADLLDRHRLQVSSRRMPSYQRTEKQIDLMMAVWNVKKRSPGESRDEAIDVEAWAWDVTPEALRKALEGKHGSLSRAERRQKRTPPSSDG